MVATLVDGIRLATNEAERQQNYLANGIATDWRDALREVVAQIAGRL